MIENILFGVKIAGYENSPDLVLCSDCIGPLLNQLGGWKNIELGKLYPPNEKNKYRICAVCSRAVTSDRRGGIDRREYDYEVHIPERRTTERRKENDRISTFSISM